MGEPALKQTQPEDSQTENQNPQTPPTETLALKYTTVIWSSIVWMGIAGLGMAFWPIATAAVCSLLTLGGAAIVVNKSLPKRTRVQFGIVTAAMMFSMISAFGMLMNDRKESETGKTVALSIDQPNPRPESNTDNQPASNQDFVLPDRLNGTFEITKTDDTSFGPKGSIRRYSAWVAVDKNLSNDDLKLISTHIARGVAQKWPFNALALFYSLRGTDTTTGYDRAKAEIAPDGDWAKAAEVKAGNYSRHQWAFDFLSAEQTNKSMELEAMADKARVDKSTWFKSVRDDQAVLLNFVKAIDQNLEKYGSKKLPGPVLSEIKSQFSGVDGIYSKYSDDMIAPKDLGNLDQKWFELVSSAHNLGLAFSSVVPNPADRFNNPRFTKSSIKDFYQDYETIRRQIQAK